MVVTFSHQVTCKAEPGLPSTARSGAEGAGRPARAPPKRTSIEQIFVASTHAYVLIFTSKGRVFWLKVHELPQAGRAARGKAIVNLVPLAEGEKIAALRAVKELRAAKKDDEEGGAEAAEEPRSRGRAGGGRGRRGERSEPGRREGGPGRGRAVHHLRHAERAHQAHQAGGVARPRPSG